VTTSPRNHYLRFAVAGAAVWPAAVALLPESEHRTIIAVLLLGPLVVVPLGLVRRSPRPVLSWCHFAAALLLCAAFSVGAEWAVALAIPWVAVSLWLGLRGLARKPASVSDVCFLAAALYLPIGAGWAACARLGYRPIGFSDTIVLLTAAHFHYAGFALPIVAGEITRRTTSRLARGAAIVAVATVPVVAAGITMTQAGGPRELELVAAFGLAATGIVLGAFQLRLAASAGAAAGACLAVSGLSLIAGLAWSPVYAGGQYGLWPGVDIPFMTRWHGIVNAFGFALVGLIGWTLRNDDP
jgi:YndJ-like protein